MKKYYSFSSTEHIEDEETLQIIGIRGKRVMELATLGAPILPGFMIPNDTVSELITDASGAKKFLISPIAKIERLIKLFPPASPPTSSNNLRPTSHRSKPTATKLPISLAKKSLCC